MLDPDETFVGTVNEDWAIESMAGDIFLLGSHSWQIQRVESARGVLRVEDAQGRPPTVPFWLGEAPARTWELSEEVSRAAARHRRRELDGDAERTHALADGRVRARPTSAATQIVDYIARRARRARRRCPRTPTSSSSASSTRPAACSSSCTRRSGRASTAAFGLALRKRFCVRFDFELQAAASDDAVVLSLGPQHSFPLEDAFEFVHVAQRAASRWSRRSSYAPMFGTRWRWNATRALAVLRQQRRQAGAAADPADARRRPAGGGVPARRSAARRTSAGRWSCPTTR